MTERKIKRALISVYDKTGIVEFAKALVEEFGIEIISTGGTATLLKENGIPVTLVEQITGFPEMLDGRVKTLHPKIHAAILADRDNPKHMQQLKEQGIEPIDMVVVRLYPFESTIEECECTFEQGIEMIDIGGPCLIRAAAKNHKHVLVLAQFDPSNREDFIDDYREGFTDEEWASFKRDQAQHAFATTWEYDHDVQRWLSKHCEFPIYDDTQDDRSLRLSARGPALRYGENPHQTAELVHVGNVSYGEADVLGDPDLDSQCSFNNFVDANSALELCKELTRAFCNEIEPDWYANRVAPFEEEDAKRGTPPLSDEHKANMNMLQAPPRRKACVFIKHTNPCGIGVSDNATDAYRLAYLGDPNAAMGSILACNFVVDGPFAEEVLDTYDRLGKAAGAGGFFVEVWIAHDFDVEVEDVLRTKKWGERVRLLSAGVMRTPPSLEMKEYRSITGAMLSQTRDLIGLNEDQWKTVTKRKPSESEISDLRLAWLVAKHTKSNAISLCKDGMLIGNGAGQMSRVMSCRIATWLANENGHAEKLKGSVAASDAFFPFADGPNILMDAGVTAIIQPGGSKRDEEVIAACDARDVAMIFTGTRHFKH